MSSTEKCAKEDGVLVSYQKNPDAATGTCAVLVNGGERSLVANLAAANTFTHAHLETAEAKEIIKNAQIYYISGFFLTVSVDSILAIAKHSVENSKIFVMNLSAPFLIQFFGDQMASTMPYTDFVFGNESEAAAYGEAKGYGSDIATIALKLSAQPKVSGTRPRIVVFTQGSIATVVAVGGVVTEYPVDPLARYRERPSDYNPPLMTPICVVHTLIDCTIMSSSSYTYSRSICTEGSFWLTPMEPETPS